MMVTSENIRVFVVEDHAVVRQGLVALLSSVQGIEVVGCAKDGQEALSLYASLAPDVTLMDLQMPQMRGVDAIQAIRRMWPAARFIVLTTFDGDEDIYRAMQAGAKAYLLKGMEVDELVQAIQAVHSGRARMSSAIAEKLAQRVSSQDLTTREIAVLERIVAGRANKEIASDLRITEATVKSHVNSLLGKMGASDRTHAAVLALQRGIVHLS
ncbi:response regulator transcription factor [Acidipila sp. EB88]|uniref:response regulator n=1 Tax=Acidipila sp. EB88 TaxID=2305226 RepID=UPI000F5E7035|nr:response regulator transcription factor [Acidipila sp. EB88]RRA47159.1 DNA-binding response regulator [Acidipila sp. EB88]